MPVIVTIPFQSESGSRRAYNKMNGSAILILLLALVSGQCIMANPHDEYATLKAGLDAINTVSEKMRHDINNQMRIKELNVVIDDIDKSMLGYQGTARKHLDEMRHLNSKARLTFSNAKGNLYEWCSSFDNTLSLTDIDQTTIDEKEKENLWNMVMTSITKGVTKTNQTISSFEEAKELRGQLEELLDRMLQDVKTDYSTKMAKSSATSIPSLVTYFFFLVSSLQCAWVHATHSSRVEREAKINQGNDEQLQLKIEKAKSLAPIEADLASYRTSLQKLSELISQSDRVGSYFIIFFSFHMPSIREIAY